MRDNEAPQGAQGEACDQWAGVKFSDLPPAEALVKRAIESLRKRVPARQPKQLRPPPPLPLWSRVGALFGHGSGYSAAICKRYGFNPYESYRPEVSP